MRYENHRPEARDFENTIKINVSFYLFKEVR